MKGNSDFVKQAALEEGFDLVGITGAVPLKEESERLSEWIKRGYHATMHWMSNDVGKRTDPDKILPGSRSVISLGRNYYVPADYPPGSAKISRYAWGDDYHIVITEMLKRYTKKLEVTFPGHEFIYYCDTGPVMDKVWAQRAGVGWIGKHTNVISQRIGSWMFLAEVITDLECEHDQPAVDHCGSCRACIDACPTQAIVEPYVLDGNRCISFLTIENRDPEITDRLAPKFEDWVFGCDICQDVCPWNEKFQTATDDPAFRPREENLNLKAEEVHLMTRVEFSTRFRKSPVKRAKFEGFQRNARALVHSR
ncbi:MAG: tRNA epoxyqueuosine(34) reductase QueG [Bacteroidetes bacterium]|nr:tRNA epoxyqueuosine(34) reductase QueG [Bacteroidota bacterium]